MRHLVVVEPTLSPADAELVRRLANETGMSAQDWEHALVGSPTLARVVAASDDVRDAHELAGQIDFCGLQARVVRLEDAKAAAARMKEAVAVERAPQSHGAFRVTLTDKSVVEVSQRDLRALVSGRQMRRGHNELFLALVRSAEPLVIVVRAPGTRLDSVVRANSPELMVSELFTVLTDAAPGVAVERALERPGAKSGVVELDDLAAAVAISALVAQASAGAQQEAVASASFSSRANTSANEHAPIDVNSLFGLAPSGAPSQGQAEAHAPAPAPFASLEIAETRRPPPAVVDAQPAPTAPPEEPPAEQRAARTRPERPARKSASSPSGPTPIERINTFRSEKPQVFYGAIAAVVVVILLAIFGRGTPIVAAQRLTKGETWKSPYGVTFTFESAFDASVGGEHVVGMTVVATKDGARESFRISGYDATRERTAFEVPFKLTEHDGQGASWIKLEAKKPE